MIGSANPSIFDFTKVVVHSNFCSVIRKSARIMKFKFLKYGSNLHPNMKGFAEPVTMSLIRNYVITREWWQHTGDFVQRLWRG